MADRNLCFSGMNLVAHDLNATIAFYRKLGMSIPDDKVWHTDSGPHHVDGIHANSDAGFDFDSQQLATAYIAGHDADSRGNKTVLGFAVGSRADVDELYSELVGAGYQSRQEPYNAFWGAR
jgi:predicted lactoylglutathione lyase